MSELSKLQPKERARIMDLVEAAGVNVEDWSNYKGGGWNPGANPKYCYEWSFVEPKKVVVLNLWHAHMEERDGSIVQDLNLRSDAQKYAAVPGKQLWERRALKMDNAIQAAIVGNLPIRIVICGGIVNDYVGRNAKTNKASKRFLDPVPWAVTAYDWKSGQCTITRGARQEIFVDQFSVKDQGSSAPERRLTSSEVFIRNPEVRRSVLKRARGRCELCGTLGFEMAGGLIYIETHHVIPLSEGGMDAASNVVGLCPNHHREAHNGLNREKIRKTLLDRLALL